MTLTKTARLCSTSPSDLAGIEDEEIAFAFNVECADILHEWEQERENEKEERQMEMLGVQAVTSGLGRAPQPKFDRTNAAQW